jgi:hypothetical protein
VNPRGGIIAPHHRPEVPVLLLATVRPPVLDARRVAPAEHPVEGVF